MRCLRFRECCYPLCCRNRTSHGAIGLRHLVTLHVALGIDRHLTAVLRSTSADRYTPLQIPFRRLRAAHTQQVQRSQNNVMWYRNGHLSATTSTQLSQCSHGRRRTITAKFADSDQGLRSRQHRGSCHFGRCVWKFRDHVVGRTPAPDRLFG